MSPTRCKVPGCQATVIHARGLCRACYIYAATLVFHKLASWEAMEVTGCVDAKKGQIQSPKRPDRTEWFSKAAGMTPDGLSAELRSRVHAYGPRRRKKA